MYRFYNCQIYGYPIAVLELFRKRTSVREFIVSYDLTYDIKL